jgi:peptidoglycan/LPS O-acetylase OafA/YrhL
LLVNLVVVLSIVGILSALTYRFVELPALRLKRSTRQQSKSSSARAEPKSAAVTATETAADAHSSADAPARSLP